MTFFCPTKYKIFIFVLLTTFIPLESRKYSPVQLVLGAGCVGSTGVDERVDCCQYKALLVEVLELGGKFPYWNEAQGGCAILNRRQEGWIRHVIILKNAKHRQLNQCGATMTNQKDKTFMYMYGQQRLTRTKLECNQYHFWKSLHISHQQ